MKPSSWKCSVLLHSLGIWEYSGYFWFRCFRQVVLYVSFPFLKTKTGTHKNIHFLTCHAITMQSNLLILRQWDKNFYRHEQWNVTITITKFTHWSFFTHPFLILWSLRPDCTITVLLMFVRVTWDAFLWLGKTGNIWVTEPNFSRHRDSPLKSVKPRLCGENRDECDPNPYQLICVSLLHAVI
jgi:hypothetical protein